MATGRKTKTKVVKLVRLRKRDVTFDEHDWMVIKNPAINRLIERRWLAGGVVLAANIICPRPPGPPPPPDFMCACAYITIGQEVSQVRRVQPGPKQDRTRPLRTQHSITVQTRGTRRTPEL